MLHSTVLIVDDKLWRGFVACREWSRARKLRTPLGRALSQLYLRFFACEGGVEADG